MQDHDGEGGPRQTERYKSFQSQQVPPPGPGTCQMHVHTYVKSFFPMFFLPGATLHLAVLGSTAVARAHLSAAS